MIVFKFWGVVLLLLLLALTIGGCQARSELSQLAMIVGVGLDTDRENGLSLTVELAHQQLSNEPGQSVTFTVSGRSLEELEEELGRRLDKEPSWSNAVSLVIGAELAMRGGIDQVMTAVYQDDRFNPGLLLMVAEDRAEGALNSKFGESEYTAQGLAEALHQQARRNGSKPLTVADYLGKRLAGSGPVELPLLAVQDGQLLFAGTAAIGAAKAPALYAYE